MILHVQTRIARMRWCMHRSIKLFLVDNFYGTAKSRFYPYIDLLDIVFYYIINCFVHTH